MVTVERTVIWEEHLNECESYLERESRRSRMTMADLWPTKVCVLNSVLVRCRSLRPHISGDYMNGLNPNRLNRGMFLHLKRQATNGLNRDRKAVQRRNAVVLGCEVSCKRRARVIHLRYVKLSHVG